MLNNISMYYEKDKILPAICRLITLVEHRVFLFVLTAEFLEGI